ncbi:MAG: GNAT family N-acetyltransferase [Filifactoraceae bacterium]
MSIRELCFDDVKPMISWMNDDRVSCYFTFHGKVFTEEMGKNFVKASLESTTEKHMAIVDDNNRYLGTVSLKDIDMKGKKAEFAIALSYEAQGKGIARKATDEILEYGFNILGLERIFLNVLSDNYRAIRLYESCGFTYEGEFKKHFFINGEVRDIKWFAIFKFQYEQNKMRPDFFEFAFSELGDERGGMVVVEGMKNIPFEIQRAFYIYGSDSSVIRGQHANRISEFVFINVSGSSKVMIDNGREKTIVLLDKPHKGLYLNKMMWKDMYDFSPDSVLLVLTNTKYNPEEYIRDYQDYIGEVAKKV